ncbi:hypothetical protein [Pseudorhodoferax sp.]|uniref:hypothetical protein n=1 Tax=Pseudorhodoferax sp. TaxID=1993553 RepID=UPI0039E702DE
MPPLCLAGGRTNAATARIAGLLRTAHHQVLPGMGHLGPVTHAQAVDDRLVCFLGMARAPQAGPFLSSTTL